MVCGAWPWTGLRTCHLEKNSMYNTIPNEADLNTLEYLFGLSLNPKILALIMRHYFDLRLDDVIDGTPGLPPKQALHKTMQWAADVRLIAQPACIA
jgi:hypothetical protein